MSRGSKQFDSIFILIIVCVLVPIVLTIIGFLVRSNSLKNDYNYYEGVIIEASEPESYKTTETKTKRVRVRKHGKNTYTTKRETIHVTKYRQTLKVSVKNDEIIRIDLTDSNITYNSGDSLYFYINKSNKDDIVIGRVEKSQWLGLGVALISLVGSALPVIFIFVFIKKLSRKERRPKDE